MLRNALPRSNLRILPFICHFCARQPLLPRHLSTTLPAYKNRAGKRDAIPTADPDPENVLTEVRKDIKQTVTRKNEEVESKRWKQKAKNDAEPATSEAAAAAAAKRTENRRRRREKMKMAKASGNEGNATEPIRETVKHERVKREKTSKKVSVRRVNGHAPTPATPKDMGGVSLATALARRPKDKNILTMDPANDSVKPIDMKDSKKPPAIKHDLDRVLFNPGVHYLQDPHSHVFNFDPYLRDIMPVSEFDFAAVDGYVTSSRDTKLSALAVALGKKYVGSTSSMTSVLSHFHYLLSHWRNINAGALSKDFPAEYNTFTQLSRAPAAVFLRYKGAGTYAIDPDKEFDVDSILSLLGRSLEKMLTMSPTEYAALRVGAGAPPAASPDTFHYSTLGDFLMRSQLDAYDQRLPGTGMFDLKTRAVVSVRMDVANFHLGSGYQIKTLRGQWESFEREYFDMIRAAFLKYSLQVRMGRMDGIFVAFHNTERIFGFQYVSLEEMDSSLHEAWGSGVGEREFVLSLMFLNEALNRATARFPEQSLRLYFETRETQTPQMYITAEPMAEADIEEIQNRNKRDLDEFLKSLELKRDSLNRKADIEGAPEEAVETEAGVGEAVEVNERETEEPEGRETGEMKGGEKAEDAESIELDTSDKEIDIPVWESGQRGAEGVESAANVAMIDGIGMGTDDQDAVQVAQDVDEDDDDENDAEDDDDDDDSDSDSDSDSDDDETEAKTEAETEAEAEAEVEEIPDEHMEKSAPDAEVDLNTKPSAAVPGFERPLLAMTLTTYNQVNGRPVLRPSILRAGDKWTVDYTITEAKTNDRAWATYNSIKTRRRKAVEGSNQPVESEEVSQYVKYLRTLSKSGRAWEAEQEAQFGGERVVYKGQESEKGDEGASG